MTSSAFGSVRQFSAINTTKLASQYKEFQFLRIPQFVRNNERITSTAKYLYGEFNFKAGEKGYVSGVTRDQLAAEARLDLPRYKRALAELTKEKLILSLPCGNGKPNVYILLAHPDMHLSEDELKKRQIKFPRQIQIRIDRAARKTMQIESTAIPASSNMNQQIPAAVSNASQLSNSLNIPFIDTSALPWPITVVQIDLQKEIDPSMAVITSSAIPLMPITNDQPQKMKSVKPTSRRPRSRHSLELCLRFAQAERERKGTIENVQNFGESCYSTGWHDKEIDQWLRRKASIEVGRYQTAKQNFERPNYKQNRSEVGLTKIEPIQTQQKGQKAEPEELAKIHLWEKLEDDREIAFNALDDDAKEGLIIEKMEQFADSDKQEIYRRWPKEKLIEKAIWEIKKELIPDL